MDVYGLSGYDYRVAALSKSYLTVIGISIQSLNSIGNSNLFKITKRANCNGRTDVRTDPNYRKASLLKRNNLNLI